MFALIVSCLQTPDPPVSPAWAIRSTVPLLDGISLTLAGLTIETLLPTGIAGVGVGVAIGVGVGVGDGVGVGLAAGVGVGVGDGIVEPDWAAFSASISQPTPG